MQKILAIVDGYTDEPAGLGVPPYIGTYPRIIAGAAKALGYEVYYLTIDDLRYNIGGFRAYKYNYNKLKRVFNLTPNHKEARKILERSSYIVAIAGIHTPGKYLSAEPATIDEMIKYLKPFPGVKILAGPAAYGSQAIGGHIADLVKEGFDYVEEDAEALLWYLHNGERKRDTSWYALGAFIVKQHPRYPLTIAEIELGRGCIWGRCSFCTEGMRYKLWFRDEYEVLEEIRALYDQGVRFFRLGRIADFWSYRFTRGKPNVEAIERLLKGIWKVAKPEVLHIDNADPHVIASYEESIEITKLLVRYTTAGNVASLGMETADEEVAKANMLNSTPDEVMKAIEIINKYGSVREKGIPKLLPGVNLIFGLYKETEETYYKDYEFLKEVYDKGLMLRRINIREVAIFPGTFMAKIGLKYLERHRHLAIEMRKKIREEIDRPMMRRVWPRGLVIEAYTEINKGRITFARPLGSYPIILGIKKELPLARKMRFLVVNYMPRSIIALPLPIEKDISLIASTLRVDGKTAKEIVSLPEEEMIRRILEVAKEKDIYEQRR